MGWKREETKRYGGEDYMTKFQREGGSKGAPRIPNKIIIALATIATIVVVMALANIIINL